MGLLSGGTQCLSTYVPYVPCSPQTAQDTLEGLLMYGGGGNCGSCTGEGPRPRHILAASQNVQKAPGGGGSRGAAVGLLWGRGEEVPGVDKEGALRGLL